MGVVGVMGLLLLSVVLLTMPGAQANCGQNEYPHGGLCCVLCEAGTFVADHCSVSHWRGKCGSCKEGKSFTAHANGLEGCVPCRQCNEDQITLRPCTVTQDAECQCKHGYSCADEGCEICERISQMPPDGKGISQNSTDATDAGSPSQGMSPLVWIILGLSVFVLVVVIVVVKKLKCDKAASIDKDAERGLVQEPNQITAKDLSQSELGMPSDVFIAEKPPQQCEQLMKTQLQENDTEEIISTIFSSIRL